MKKYLLIGFLILAFSLIAFAQGSPKFKIEDFVWAKISTDKTAIYVGDRFELKLEIVCPKDWGIEILVDDLKEESMRAVLPDSVILEKAEAFKPIPWGEYWIKLKTTYILFYPEKKDKAEILFKPIRVRFKLVDKEDEEPRKKVEVYEVETRPLALGVRSTLTTTSNEIRDAKTFSGKFLLKAGVALAIGLILVILGLFIPVKTLIRLAKKQKRGKKLALKQLLKAECRKLQAVSKISDLNKFSDSFCVMLRNLIGIKTGLNALSMTAAEIKEKVAKDKSLTDLANLIKEHDDFRYNPESNPIHKKEAVKTVEEILSGWMPQRRFWKKFRMAFKTIISVIKMRKGW